MSFRKTQPPKSGLQLAAMLNAAGKTKAETEAKMSSTPSGPANPSLKHSTVQPKNMANTKTKESPMMKSSSSFLTSHLPNHAFSINDVNYWGGAEDSLFFDDWDLVICLLEKPRVPTYPKMYHGADKILPQNLLNTKFPPILHIPVPDGSAPSLPLAWWNELVLGIESAACKDVLVHCLGGLGRTGTVLCAIAGAAIDQGFQINDNNDDSNSVGDDVVSFIRKVYQPTAVETYEQIDYLRSLGFDTTERSMFGGAGYPGGYGLGGAGSSYTYKDGVTKFTPANPVSDLGPGTRN